MSQTITYLISNDGSSAPPKQSSSRGHPYRPAIPAFATLGPTQWLVGVDETTPRPDLILLLDRYGVCREYLTEGIFGPTGQHDAQVGRTIAELFEPTLAQQLLRCNRQLFATQQAQSCQVATMVGEHQLMLEVRFTYCGTNRALVVLRDVTAQYEAEHLQHEREALLYSLIDNLPSAMLFQIIIAPEREQMPEREQYFTYVSAGVEQLSGGLSAQAVLENSALLLEQTLAADRLRLAAAQRNTVETGLPFAVQVRKQLPSGELRWSLIRATYHTTLPDGSAVINGFELDITEQKRSEEGLQLRNRILEIIPHGVLVADSCAPDHPITYVNPGFERLTGYSVAEVAGRNCRFLQGAETDPLTTARLRAAIQANESCMVELMNYRKDGTPFWNALTVAPLSDDTGTVTHMVGVQTDVTAFKLLEAQFQQAQKMEAVGRLAGGVAHDFNNILTIVNSYCEMILRAHTLDPSIRRQVGQIRDASERGAALTNQLLAFSRKQVVKPVVLDLNQVITRMQKMITRLIGEDIAMHIQLAPQPPYIKMDLGQFEQILLNLAVNARDAMPKGGMLTIRLHTVYYPPHSLNLTMPGLLGAAFSAVNLPAISPPAVYPPGSYPPGNYVQISVYDTGEGMNEQTRAHIFEPFFTTKPSGKGTGLGLSTVYGVVSQNGGFIHVESEVGRGSAFHLWLPQTEAVVTTIMPLPAASSIWGSQLDGGTETILVVEDDNQIRALTTLILQEKGYTILAAANAREATELAASAPYAIDLLVTDMIMPGGNGLELFALLTARQPTLKVLFVSGYTQLEISQHELVIANDFLPKPFTLELLLRKVRDVLDRPIHTPVT